MKIGRISLFSFCAGVLMLGFLSGCAQHYNSAQSAAAASCRSLGPRALSGALIGAGAGAAVGAGVGAVAAGGKGAAIGAIAGGVIGLVGGLAEGHHLDQGDCNAAQAALQRLDVARTGQPIPWSDPSTGSQGVFIAASNAYSQPDGRICRRVRSTVTIAGRAPVTDNNGIVCRDQNGDWERVAE